MQALFPQLTATRCAELATAMVEVGATKFTFCMRQITSHSLSAVQLNERMVFDSYRNDHARSRSANSVRVTLHVQER